MLNIYGMTRMRIVDKFICTLYILVNH